VSLEALTGLDFAIFGGDSMIYVTAIEDCFFLIIDRFLFWSLPLILLRLEVDESGRFIFSRLGDESLFATVSKVFIFCILFGEAAFVILCSKDPAARLSALD
jgi:hypothetical protein